MRGGTTGGAKLLPIILAAVGALIVIGGAAYFLFLRDKPTASKPDAGRIAQGVHVAGIDLSNMTRAEAEAALAGLPELYQQEMRLTLKQEPRPVPDPAEQPEASVPENSEPVPEELLPEPTEPAPEVLNEDIELVLPAAELDLRADVDRAVEAALGVGSGSGAPAPAVGQVYDVPARAFLTLSESAVRAKLDEAVEATGAEADPADTREKTRTEKREVEVPVEDGAEGETRTEMRDVQILSITLGGSKCSFKSEELYNALMDAYTLAAFPPDSPEPFTYTVTPAAVPDVDALFEKYCKEAEDAKFSGEGDEIVPETVGYGFDREELQKLLDEAKPGDTVEIELHELLPEVTEESLRGTLFSDILGYADTNHTWESDRTTNLKLACEQINGTVLMPGEVFSFNKTVGQRTAEKGYKPAIAFVSGGESKPEIGGGICQVATTIYWACLRADMEVTERSEHMYLVGYADPGMDATIYWGSLDYCFRNNTEHPIRIDAYVSDGQVHVRLVGTFDRDYTVELGYEILEVIPPTVEEVKIKNNEYRPGEVIQSGRTGYRVKTYKNIYDLNGNLLRTETIAYNNYRMTPKKIAVADETAPTEPPDTTPPDTTPPDTTPPDTTPPDTTPPDTTPPDTTPPDTTPPDTTPPDTTPPDTTPPDPGE